MARSKKLQDDLRALLAQLAKTAQPAWEWEVEMEGGNADNPVVPKLCVWITVVEEPREPGRQIGLESARRAMDADAGDELRIEILPPGDTVEAFELTALVQPLADTATKALAELLLPAATDLRHSSTRVRSFAKRALRTYGIEMPPPPGPSEEDLVTWLEAPAGTPLVDALSNSRFATANMSQTETDDAVRIRFGGRYAYVLSPEWAKQAAAGLSDIEDAPPTSPAGQWRDSYVPFLTSLDCPGNRMLKLYVFDHDTSEIRLLNLEEGFGLKLADNPIDLFALLAYIDKKNLLVATHPDPEAPGEEALMNEVEFEAGCLLWHELSP